ncbi:MAG TPA: DUF308 domain-containing protein [Candidatus Fusicatenibacter intestinigallinarum]|uniref:DUF308 domain-containing protein n=1 Tax=Candidatus Fusicatenibacter intestinigallinarum TaxID=2838598 RepID=A0A9D2NAF0_9FIRM|nr:DUF308 domain-containing protein [Candidatus Fusicatenibacter intestinigallinarum]
MKQIFRDVRNNFLLTAIVSVLIGLVLVLFPVRTTFMICNIAGILLIVCGIINIIRYVTSKGEAFFIRYDLVVGVILCLAGLFVITQSHLIISFIPTIVGIVLLINGIINLKKAFHLKQAGLQRWWVDLAIAAVITLLGLLIWLRPFDAVATTNIFIGICLILNGVSNLCTMFGLGTVKRRLEMHFPDDDVIDVEDDELH